MPKNSSIEEWSSYAPDGRRLSIRRSEDGQWSVACGDSGEEVSADLAEAMRRAVFSEHAVEARPDRERIERWIADQARQVESEAADR